MSRSYKKTPIVKCGGMGKDGKRFAKRKWRRINNEDNIDRNRSLYKRFYDQYDIHDYTIRNTKEETIRRYEYIKAQSKLNDIWANYYRRELKRYPTLKDYLEKYYYKYYRRK